MLAQCTWQPCSSRAPSRCRTKQQRGVLGQTHASSSEDVLQGQPLPPLPTQGQAPTEAQSPASALQQQQQQQCPISASSSNTTYEFTYRGSDGRVKATFEQAFKNLHPGKANAGPEAPWALSYQMAEKYTMWNDELKARMIKRVAADELGIPDEDLETRLERVQLLLPDIKTKLASMKAVLVAQLAADVEMLPGRLLRLKNIFPGAAAGVLAMRQPELVLGFDLDRVESIATELRQLLPTLDVDRLVEENPAMLDVPGLKKAIADAQRIMPQLDVQKAMATDPQLIFSFQTGSQLIPYDPPRPEEKDDDEYAAYYG